MRQQVDRKLAGHASIEKANAADKNICSILAQVVRYRYLYPGSPQFSLSGEEWVKRVGSGGFRRNTGCLLVLLLFAILRGDPKNEELPNPYGVHVNR